MSCRSSITSLAARAMHGSESSSATFDLFQSQLWPVRSWFAGAVSQWAHEDGWQKMLIPRDSPTRVFPFRQTRNKRWLLYCAVLRIRQLWLTQPVWTTSFTILLPSTARFYSHSCICELGHHCLHLMLLLASTHASYSSELMLLLASTRTSCSCESGHHYTPIRNVTCLKVGWPVSNQLTHSSSGYELGRNISTRCIVFTVRTYM